MSLENCDPLCFLIRFLCQNFSRLLSERPVSYFCCPTSSPPSNCVWSMALQRLSFDLVADLSNLEYAYLIGLEMVRCNYREASSPIICCLRTCEFNRAFSSSPVMPFVSLWLIGWAYLSHLSYRVNIIDTSFWSSVVFGCLCHLRLLSIVFVICQVKYTFGSDPQLFNFDEVPFSSIGLNIGALLRGKDHFR